jgi:hypothetical protein
MEMSNSELAKFRNWFNFQMKNAESEFGIKVTIGNISYNEAGFNTKLEAKNLTKTGEIMIDPIHEDKARYVFSMAGLGSGPVIGHKWELKDGNIVRIKDYNSRRSAYPVSYTRNGQSYKCAVSFIRGPIDDRA